MATGSGSHTRKGTKANHPSIKLITVTNGDEIKRIPRNVADILVKSSGWSYCPKRFVIIGQLGE